MIYDMLKIYDCCPNCADYKETSEPLDEVKAKKVKLLSKKLAISAGKLSEQQSMCIFKN